MPDYSEIDSALAVFEDLRKVHPLTVWRAWDRPAPRTSQLRAMQALPDTRKLVAFGGNRSGKTELFMLLLVALTLGSDHPDVRALWLAHGIDPDKLPAGPDRGWAIATTSNDSLRYHRRQILALVPKWGPRHPDSEGEGRNWHARNLLGRGEASLEVMVPGYQEPAQFWFKSEDQGEDSYQGDAVRAAWHDEEGKSAKIYDQVKYRLIDKDGFHLVSDTPVKGKTWVYERFEDRTHKDFEPDATIVRIYTRDNPYLPAHRVKAIADDPVRGKGEFITKEGRIWSFDPALHVVEPFALPKCTRFRAIDFGTVHPFVAWYVAQLSVAVTINDGRRLPEGTLVLYREHYQTRWTLARHVARMRQIEGWRQQPGSDERDPASWARTGSEEQFELTFADPEDPQQMLQLNATYDVPCIKGIKSRLAGINEVESLLKADANGVPGIVIFDTCVETIREWGSYVWKDTKTAEGVTKQEPSGKSDHTCDCGRYMAMGLRNQGYLDFREWSESSETHD